jgi:ParB/Sulfiredoxin domain
MAKQKYVRRVAKALKDAIEKAECGHDVRHRPADGIVSIEPWKIETRPEMFQIRRFTYGHKDTDIEYVKKLERTIGIVGELDAPVVIKIDGEWVCVDGHHRIAAYNRTGWRDPIRCLWFEGTVREAVDESMRLNGKDRLNVSQQDRLERAWELVILGKHSKAEIVKLCGVGEGSVAHMRRIKKTYEEGDVGSKLFRKRLGMPLEEASWATARLAFVGAEPKERDDEERAAKLARRINSKLTNLLSRDPRVTARALEIYNPELPSALMKVWKWTLKNPQKIIEKEDAPSALSDAERPGGPLPEL